MHPSSSGVSSSTSLAPERQPLLQDEESSQNVVNRNQNAELNQDGLETVASSSDTTVKVIAVMFCFFTMGVNLSAIGALLPRMESYYHLNDTTVSLIFLGGVVGYVVSASFNNMMHANFGRRGIAIVASAFQIFQALILSLRPPYSVALLAYMIAGFGNGFVDSGWCAWAGGLPNVSVVQGLIHGSFSVGSTVGPIITILVLKMGLDWYAFYYFLLILSFIQLVSLVWAFRHDDAAKYHSEHDSDEEDGEIGLGRAVWTCAAFYLAYVGVETCLGGWLVTFMIRMRNATPSIASLADSLFWIGMAFGRFLLGPITQYFGLRPSVTVYIMLSIGLQASLILINNMIVSLLLIAALGFFLGPMFPAGVMMLTSLLPKEFHVKSVAFAAAIGQVGGAGAPFAVGAIAQVWGIGYLLVVVLGLSVLILLVWLSFPKLKKITEDEQEE